VLRKLFTYYIEANLHVSLATSTLTILTFYNLHIPIDFTLVFFVFFSTLSSYHFIRIATDYYAEKQLLFPFLKTYNTSFLILFFASILGVLYWVWQLSVQQWMIVFVAVVLTVVYAVPIIRGVSFRQIPELKIFVIALTWTLITVALPAEKLLFTYDFWVEFIQRLVLIVALTIPFDIRDFYTDPEELRTLPQRIGVEASKKTGMLLMLVFFILIFLSKNLEVVHILSELGVFALTLFFLAVAKTEQEPYFAAFWVEAVPILWLLDYWAWGWIIN
jgi:hypothetical protein